MPGNTPAHKHPGRLARWRVHSRANPGATCLVALMVAIAVIALWPLLTFLV